MCMLSSTSKMMLRLVIMCTSNLSSLISGHVMSWPMPIVGTDTAGSTSLSKEP